jgi:hypothetical protein
MLLLLIRTEVALNVIDAHRKFCENQSTGSDVEKGSTQTKYREHFDPASLLSFIDKDNYTRNIAYCHVYAICVTNNNGF